MALKILYFAGVREAVGQPSEDLPLPQGVVSVGELRAHLCARGGAWGALAAGKNLRMAVNQKTADPTAALHDGDEVAFFPPVTGG